MKDEWMGLLGMERLTDTLSSSSPEKSRLTVVNKSEGALCVGLVFNVNNADYHRTYLYYNIFYLGPSFLRNGKLCE